MEQQHGSTEATDQDTINIMIFWQFEQYGNSTGPYLLDISALNRGLILRIRKNHAGNVMTTVSLVIL